MRTIREIAIEVKQNWKSVNYGAKPYLDAMMTLESINDKYYDESGKYIVLYFLSNASSWRGDVAKRIKAELKQLTK